MSAPEFHYAQRRPERTTLHGVVRDNLETLCAATAEGYASPLPGFVKRELEGYLECGLLCREVGFERLPADLSAIDGGALVIPYIQAATDRKPLAFIDPFALAHAYLYDAQPALQAAEQRLVQDAARRCWRW